MGAEAWSSGVFLACGHDLVKRKGTALTYAFFKGCDIRLARTTGCFELLLSVSFRALTWNILDALKKTLHPCDTCDSLLSGHSPLASS
jgi:hypothetical protein